MCRILVETLIRVVLLITRVTAFCIYFCYYSGGPTEINIIRSEMTNVGVLTVDVNTIANEDQRERDKPQGEEWPEDNTMPLNLKSLDLSADWRFTKSPTVSHKFGTEIDDRRKADSYGVRHVQNSSNSN